jgi:beta-xylosidase
MLFKGRGHETYYKTEEGEAAAGYEIRKGTDDRYYSSPKGDNE